MKDRLIQVCTALGISTDLLECPKDGFTASQIEDGGRAFERAQRIVKTLTRRICELVCPANASFKAKMMGTGCDDLRVYSYKP